MRIHTCGKCGRKGSPEFNKVYCNYPEKECWVPREYRVKGTMPDDEVWRRRAKALRKEFISIFGRGGK